MMNWLFFIVCIILLLQLTPALFYLALLIPIRLKSKKVHSLKIVEKIGEVGLKYFVHKTKMIPSHHIRMFIYRNILMAHLERDVVIYFNTEIREANKLYIGEGTIIGDSCLLDCRNGLRIGKNVNFSSEVHIWTEQHDYRSPSFSCYNDDKMGVSIGDYAWLGSNTIILPRVKIGKGAVVAAGAVVTKDVPPYAVVAGIPAKKVAERPKDMDYQFNGAHSRFY